MLRAFPFLFSFAFSNLFIQRYVNSFGATAMAGMGVGRKVERYAADVSNSCGQATAIFIGQNMGGKRYDRARSGIRNTLVFSLCVITAISVPMYCSKA